jgi:hypothetical protein
MLTEFDQNTIANMTAALDYICKKIPAKRDSNELRKRIAEELMQTARSGKRSVIDLQTAGLRLVDSTARRTSSRWSGLLNWGLRQRDERQK